jgi:hypothetical protein
MAAFLAAVRPLVTLVQVRDSRSDTIAALAAAHLLAVNARGGPFCCDILILVSRVHKVKRNRRAALPWLPCFPENRAVTQERDISRRSCLKKYVAWESMGTIQPEISYPIH